jgi:hypothetical protein
MNNVTKILLSGTLAVTIGCRQNETRYNGLDSNIITSQKDTVLPDSIIYHTVRVDEKGDILPWYSPNLGKSYGDALERVWKFWKNIETDSNKVPYYMNHQVWRPNHDKRGLGGDQIMMALSSWDLYYNYTGDESLVDNMKFMADYYLENSLSSPDNSWPNIPYPYNMNVESGIYDGDMILGKNYTQPDKAGSFGYELVHLYKKTGEQKYLDAAIKIANTLASKVQPGDNDNSPWPFKVNAVTGETGVLVDHEVWYEGMEKDLHKKSTRKSSYTTFFTGTMNLFSELVAMNKGNVGEYKKAFDITFKWMERYPAKTNKWGPFFEDVPRWSDTQINAITYAMFLMENRNLSPNWKQTVNNIFSWVYDSLTDNRYAKYGVKVIDEQTAYRQPGNSHSSRQASMELLYWKLTGDTTYVRNAVKMLNWATYMVDDDGKNFYPTNDIWLTDGYGDYTRHYLRAMAACPELAPDDSDHLLKTSSIIKKIAYEPAKIQYVIYDSASHDLLRIQSKPKEVKVNGALLNEVKDDNTEGWTWQSLDKGGVLNINQSKGNLIEIIK